MIDVMPKGPVGREYLGDGLYVEYNGWDIALIASDGIRDTNIVYLEPSVFDSLLEYAKRVGLLKA